jgi:SPP1 family predicted phage head-tail adaptor
MSTDMRHKVQVWGKVKTKNEIGETTYQSSLLKSLWAAVIPQTGALQRQQVETLLSNVTHKVIIRYESGKDVTQDMYLMFRGKRFDIKYILNPYFTNETLELFCEEVIE